MRRGSAKAHHPHPSAFALWADFALKRARPRVAVLPDFGSPDKPKARPRKAKRRRR